MAEGNHVGKIEVTERRTASSITATRTARRASSGRDQSHMAPRGQGAMARLYRRVSARWRGWPSRHSDRDPYLPRAESRSTVRGAIKDGAAAYLAQHPGVRSI